MIRDRLITTTTPEDIVIFYENINSLSKEAQFVCYLIFNNTDKLYIPYMPKKTKGNIKKCLKKYNITDWKIRRAFREIKKMLDNDGL